MKGAICRPIFLSTFKVRLGPKHMTNLTTGSLHYECENFQGQVGPYRKAQLSDWVRGWPHVLCTQDFVHGLMITGPWPKLLWGGARSTQQGAPDKFARKSIADSYQQTGNAKNTDFWSSVQQIQSPSHAHSARGLRKKSSRTVCPTNPVDWPAQSSGPSRTEQPTQGRGPALAPDSLIHNGDPNWCGGDSRPWPAIERQRKIAVAI